MALILLRSFFLPAQETNDAYEEAERYNQAGVEFLDNDNYDMALDGFNRALAQYEHYSFYVNRAAAYFRLGKYDASLADCEYALRIEGDRKNHDRTYNIYNRVEL